MARVARLRERRLRRCRRDFLVYRALWPKLERAIRGVLDGYSATPEEAPRPKQPVVLDVGCGQRPYADLFADARYFGLNFTTQDATPHLVGDAQRLPIASGSIDIVFSTQVIEHVPHPEHLLQEAWRILKPGGSVILSGPFYWPLHEEPHDYFRFTRYGFERLLADAGFADVSVTGDCGAVTQIAVSIVEFLPRWLWPLVPVINTATPFLERFWPNSKSTLNYVAIGRKSCPDESITRRAG